MLSIHSNPDETAEGSAHCPSGPTGATAEEVKTRYKARIKKFHPDANSGDRSYEEKLNKVIQAYNYLKASGFC